jgi:hypothetical protein
MRDPCLDTLGLWSSAGDEASRLKDAHKNSFVNEEIFQLYEASAGSKGRHFLY